MENIFETTTENKHQDIAEINGLLCDIARKMDILKKATGMYSGVSIGNH